MPLVVIMSFLFIALALHHIERLESDRFFLNERKNVFHHQMLLQKASIDMLADLEIIDTITERAFDYREGKVTCEVIQNQAETVTVTMTSATKISEHDVTITYHKENKRIIAWE